LAKYEAVSGTFLMQVFENMAKNSKNPVLLARQIGQSVTV